MIGQFARASHVDSAWLGRGLGRGIVNLIGGGVAGTNKDRTRPAAAVSSTAARAPDGELDVQLGSSVDFSRSVPLAGCLAAASREETDPHFSEKCELTLVWGGSTLLANSHRQRQTLRDGKWRIAAAAATRGTTTARSPQT